jgi:hypothetical protein
MKRGLVLMLAGMFSVAAQATLIDDFEDGDVSDYTTVVMYDHDHDGVLNISVLEAVGGQWQVTTTVYDNIEQTAYIKNGYTLSVGQELQLDFAHNGGDRAGGIFVGLMPTAGIRSNYINVYAEANGTIYTRGFNGTSEMTIASVANADYTTMFIRRYGEYDYLAGFYDASGAETILKDRIGLVFGGTSDIVIGLYTDIRAAGTVGVGDNLTIVPEPATLAILGLGSLVLRKRK